MPNGIHIDNAYTTLHVLLQLLFNSNFRFTTHCRQAIRIELSYFVSQRHVFGKGAQLVLALEAFVLQSWSVTILTEGLLSVNVSLLNQFSFFGLLAAQESSGCRCSFGREMQYSTYIENVL